MADGGVGVVFVWRLAPCNWRARSVPWSVPGAVEYSVLLLSLNISFLFLQTQTSNKVLLFFFLIF